MSKKRQIKIQEGWRAYLSFALHMIEINWRLFIGMWKLTRLNQPVITVFGGSRLEKDSPYSQKAATLGRDLARDGFSIITGGGPGIMEAANMGAYEFSKDCKGSCKAKECDAKHCKRRLVTIGIGVEGLAIERLNPYTQDLIIMDHFFTRKWLLVRYSVGFVVFPGGFGTLDELFEVVTLIQTEKMPPTAIVLVGKDYWQPLLDFITGSALAQGLVEQKDIEIFTVVDDPDEAAAIIKEKCAVCEL